MTQDPNPGSWFKRRHVGGEPIPKKAAEVILELGPTPTSQKWRSRRIDKANNLSILPPISLSNTTTSLPNLIEGDEETYWPNCQTNLDIILHWLPQKFWLFGNMTAYHSGLYGSSSPSAKEPHGHSLSLFLSHSLRWYFFDRDHSTHSSAQHTQTLPNTQLVISFKRTLSLSLSLSDVPRHCAHAVWCRPNKEKLDYSSLVYFF